MKLLKKTNKNKEKKLAKENSKIKKSKEIIKNEKEKIKAEKRRKRKIQQEKFNKTKISKFLKKIFLIKEDNPSTNLTIKNQILSMIYFELIGAIICLIILFILTGGKNYFKLYKELSRFIDTYDTLTSEYYGDLNKEELVNSAISSMLDSVKDSYTNYSDEGTTESFKENVTGTYEGIGATVMMDEKSNIVVAEIFENSPAAQAGLKEKDIVTKVNGEDYTNKTSQELANYIKGSTKEKITLTILRDNKEKEITIIRNKIELPTISGKLIEQDNKKIGYISISIFSSVSNKQFEDKLKELENDKIEGLIIDVRDNTGGYLSTVTDITSLFLKKNQVIYQLQDSSGITKIKDKTKENRTYPIAVLVNKSSASASEILASAIKESYKGHVVGTQTYGKGSVQKTKTLKDGSMIKYTAQKWLTPKGNWINEIGVEPTESIELDTTKEEDNQLQKAISIIIDDIK